MIELQYTASLPLAGIREQINYSERPSDGGLLRVFPVMIALYRKEAK